MNQARRIAKCVMNVLCILLFVILVLVIYAKLKITFTGNKVHANYFGYRILEIASGSMEPTLSKNDIVLVKVNTKDIKNNDIISYIGEKDAVITHRVIRVEKDKLIVKGDANNTDDSPISKSQVIGKVVHVYPNLGVWKKILTEPKTLILILITFIFFDAALSYDPNKQDKNEKKEKKQNVKIEKIKEDKEKKENKEEQIKEEVKEKLDKKEIEEEATGDKKLLEFTRKINLEEIDLVLKKGKKSKKQTEEIEVLSEYEDGYTVRLDLNEIQKNINKIDK